jgi:hypothetical protein
MKSLVFLTISLFASVTAIADTDTLSKPKFHIQFGLTNMNFIDRYGFNTSDNNSIFSIFYPKFNYSIDYKTNKRSSIGFSYQFYTLNNYYKLRGQNEISGSKNGDLLRKSKGIISLIYCRDFYFPLKRNLNFYFRPNASALYSYGNDQVFLYEYPDPNRFDFASVGVDNKGFGLGIGTEIGAIVFKHFSLSASLNYNYIFETGKYEEFQPEYYKYTPSRNILTFQPKIGFLF